MWQGGDFPLEHVGANPMEKGEKKGEKKENGRKKRKEKRRGVRSSNFSLEFPEIGPSVRVGSKSQSWSTHRELCVGTKISGFRQTPTDRELSYLDYF